MYIAFCQFTSKGLIYAGRMKNLRVVKLMENQISPQVVSRLMANLAEMRKIHLCKEHIIEIPSIGMRSMSSVRIDLECARYGCRLRGCDRGCMRI